MAKTWSNKARKDGLDFYRPGGGTIGDLVFTGDPLNGSSNGDLILAQSSTTINGLGGGDLILGDIAGFRASSTNNHSFAAALDLDPAIGETWTTNENPLVADSSVPHLTAYVLATAGMQEYFKIVIPAGQTITIDIDAAGGLLGTGATSTDTIVHLFISTNTTTAVAQNDDRDSPLADYGSAGTLDSFVTYTNTGATALFYIRVQEFSNTNDFNFEADDEFLLNVSLTGHGVQSGFSQGNDTIDGGINDDHLFGAGGNDILIGGTGADLMHGGTGNDIFGVDSALDAVVELAGQGDDTVSASVSYVLAGGASVEAIATGSQAGTAAINLTGNEVAQSIFGNEGNNQLLGLDGNDQLTGYGGNDVLVGGNGIDYLRGGLGNDVYGIGEGDIILETVGEGDDSLAADIGSYFLNEGASIESLSTANQAGTFAQNLTGNDFGQSVSGSEGANVLNGGLGNDLLRGYGGADIFLFDTAPGANNHDVIADMQIGVDKIALQNNIFTGLAEGNLGANAFRIGTAAQDADDRIIWNAATNQLFFDADGNGAGAAILFAIVNGSPNLQATDFIIV